MGKLVKGALPLLATAAAIALAIPTAGGSTLLAAGLGISGTAAAGLAGGLAVTSSLLSGRAVPQSQTQLGRLQARLDPRAGRKIVLGRTAMPLDLRYYEGSGEDERTIEYIGACAAHRIQAFEQLWIEDTLAWTAAGGVEPEFAPYLGVEGYTEGGPGATRAINGGARWGSDDRLTGCAYLYIRVERLGASEDEQSPFVNGLPGRVTVIGTGIQEYDPRFDSTAGGNGPQRADQQDTWGPSTGNPIIESVTTLLGWRINGKLSVGGGIPAKFIDMESVITAANICDEAIALSGGGTQPRYRTAGAFSTLDSPMAIVGALLAGCAGDLLDANGKLSFLIKANTLASPAVEFDDNDVLSPPKWEVMGGQTNLPNIIAGSFTDPGQNALYQLVPYPSVSLPSEDGIERTAPLDLGVVENSAQAERLAAQTLQRMQFPGVLSADFNMKGLAATVGSIIHLTYSPLGFVSRPFRVVVQKPSRTGRIALVLAQEDEAIYQWDAADSAPVQAASPVVFDPLNTGPILLARLASERAKWSKTRDDDGTKPDANATRNVGRGIYRSDATYSPGDIASFLGSGYIRIGTGDTTDVDPTDATNWDVVVERGAPGENGDPGEAGLDGNDGQSGTSVAEINVYRRASATPGSPSGGSFDFATGALTAPSGWSVGVPAGSNPVYVSRGLAITNTPSGSDEPDWGPPALAFSNGQAVDAIFRRSTSQPAKPAASSGVPSGWFSSISNVPAGSDPIWTSFGKRASPVSDWIWQAAVRSEGIDGDNGDDGNDGQDGLDGQDGDPGADSFVVTPSVPALAVAANSTGVVIEGLPFTITMSAKLGGDDVTGTTSFSNPVMTGATVAKAGANGYEVSAIAASNASFTFTASRAGYSQTVTIPLTRLNQGSAAQRVEDTTIVNTASSTYVQVGGVLTLNVPRDHDATLSFSEVYEIAGTPPQGSQGRKRLRFMYRNVTDGGAWTQLGAELVGSYAVANYNVFPSEPEFVTGNVGGTRTVTNAAAATKVFEFRIDMLREGVAVNASTTPFGVEISA